VSNKDKLLAEISIKLRELVKENEYNFKRMKEIARRNK
jgi:hypothetical protein